MQQKLVLNHPKTMIWKKTTEEQNYQKSNLQQQKQESMRKTCPFHCLSDLQQGIPSPYQPPRNGQEWAQKRIHFVQSKVLHIRDSLGHSRVNIHQNFRISNKKTQTVLEINRRNINNSLQTNKVPKIFKATNERKCFSNY